MYQDSTERLALAPAVRSANTTVNGTSIDQRGTPYYRSLTFVVIAGAITDGTHTLVLQESADNSTWTNIADANLVGTTNSVALTASTVTSAHYKGSEPYVRVALTTAGATVGGLFAAIVVQSEPRHSPAR